MQVNIDTALVREAIEKLAKKALEEIDNPTSSLGGMAREALWSPTKQMIVDLGNIKF